MENLIDTGEVNNLDRNVLFIGQSLKHEGVTKLIGDIAELYFEGTSLWWGHRDFDLIMDSEETFDKALLSLESLNVSTANISALQLRRKQILSKVNILNLSLKHVDQLSFARREDVESLRGEIYSKIQELNKIQAIIISEINAFLKQKWSLFLDMIYSRNFYYKLIITPSLLDKITYLVFKFNCNEPIFILDINDLMIDCQCFNKKNEKEFYKYKRAA